MRTFRRAALASATAIALTLGATTVAVADETKDEQKPGSSVTNSNENKGDSDKKSSDVKDKLGSSDKKDDDEKASDNKTSSDVKDKLGSSDKKDDDKKGSSDNKDKGAQLSSKGNSGLNSSEFGKMLDGDKPVNGRDVFGSEVETDIPAWARVLRLITATTLIGSFFGLIVFPVYNFLKFNNWVH